MRVPARIKMGYYPTPVRVVDAIKRLFSFPRAAWTVFDPCCGEGIALQQLAEGTPAITYGVELDEHRAEESRKRLAHVLGCGIEQTRIAHRSCSLLFLNPPYDDAQIEDTVNGKTERQEKIFLRSCIPYLVPGGVLVYIIPQNRLDKGIAKILANSFTRLSVYRFADPDYAAFRQIVIFGVRRERNSLDEREARRLQNVPNVSLPLLTEQGDADYIVPPSGPIRFFRSTVIDPQELEKQIKQSPLWRRLHAMTTGAHVQMPRPPLPLHAGHLGLLLAAGKLDGLVGSGNDRHVVKGKVRKTTTKVQAWKDDVLEERELDRYVVSIKILNGSGQIKELT